MYAIIEDSGTQIKVQEGDVLDVDQRDLGSDEPQDAEVTFDRVLLVGDETSEQSANVGTPYVNGANVTAKVLDAVKGDKIDVIKFKRRQGYRRKKGHRQQYLRIQVTGINC